MLIEPMEDSPGEESQNDDSNEDEKKVSRLQEIMTKFSSDIAENIRKLISTKTSEGEEKVTQDISNKDEQIQNIIDDAKNTNQNIDSTALKDKIQKMILEEETRIREEQTSQGVNIEILNEQEKIRSIVNKYIQ
jgi:hypothetical protein